jgi:L-asparagine transporter-like permease
MRYIVREADESEEEKRRKRRKRRLAILLCASGIGVGIAMRLVESLHPGTFAYLLSISASLAVAIWNMICDVASACGGFLHYVKNVRSG